MDTWTQNLSTNTSGTDDFVLYRRLANTLYYFLLLPIAFFGNVLTIVVVACIVRHQRTRRSIPDVLLGVLACVDLFSVVFIHSVSVSALLKGAKTLPPGICAFQAFMCSVYLKMEFSLQVLISIDRHLALVRPLTYHRLSSLRVVVIILVCVLGVCVASTALTLLLTPGPSPGGFSSVVPGTSLSTTGTTTPSAALTVLTPRTAFVDGTTTPSALLSPATSTPSALPAPATSTPKATVLDTWPLCLYTWDFYTPADYVLVAITGLVFVAGACAFIVCNVTLVRILWHYHTKRAQMVFQGITDAVEAMNRGPAQHWNRTPSVQHGEIVLPGGKKHSIGGGGVAGINGAGIGKKHSIGGVGGIGAVVGGKKHSLGGVPGTMGGPVGKKHSLCTGEILIDDPNRRGSKTKTMTMNGNAATSQNSISTNSKTLVNATDSSNSSSSSNRPKQPNGSANHDNKGNQEHRGLSVTTDHITTSNSNNSYNMEPHENGVLCENSTGQIIQNGKGQMLQNDLGQTLQTSEVDEKPAYDTCIEMSANQPNSVHVKLTPTLSTASNGGHANKHELQTGVAYNRSNSNPCPISFQRLNTSSDFGRMALSLISDPEFPDEIQMEIGSGSPSGSNSRSQEQSPNTQTSFLATEEDFNDLGGDDNNMDPVPDNISDSPDSPPLIVIQSATGTPQASPDHAPEESDLPSDHTDHSQRLTTATATTSSTLKKSVSFADDARSCSSSDSGPEGNEEADAGTSLLSPTPGKMVRKHKPPRIVIDGHPLPPTDGGGIYPVPSPRTPAYSTNGHQFQHFQSQVHKVLIKLKKKADKQKKELLLAKLVVLGASLFILTWTPYVSLIVLSLADISPSPILEDLSLKLIFLNAVMNPLFYGLCRKNYRKGYDFVTQSFCHYLSLGCIEKPGEDKVFYESRRRKQKRQQLAMDAVPHAHEARNNRNRRRSAPALQILQQTLALRSPSPHGLLPTPLENPPSPPKPATGSPSSPGVTDHNAFMPSRKLQDLFQRYMEETSDSSTAATSSIDYDALLFDGDEELLQNLKIVWSMYMSVNELTEYDDDDDIELDVDYDELVGRDYIGQSTLQPQPLPISRSTHSMILQQKKEREISQFAMSTPNFKRSIVTA